MGFGVQDISVLIPALKASAGQTGTAEPQFSLQLRVTIIHFIGLCEDELK